MFYNLNRLFLCEVRSEAERRGDRALTLSVCLTANRY